jgi:hypothetical protein
VGDAFVGAIASTGIRLETFGTWAMPAFEVKNFLYSHNIQICENNSLN